MYLLDFDYHGRCFSKIMLNRISQRILHTCDFSGTHLEGVSTTRANRSRICLLLRIDIGYTVHCDVIPSIRNIGPHSGQHQLRLLQEGAFIFFIKLYALQMSSSFQLKISKNDFLL